MDTVQTWEEREVGKGGAAAMRRKTVIDDVKPGVIPKHPLPHRHIDAIMMFKMIF